MNDMFCFQCEQTAGGKGCTKVGVCGKKPDVANLQDQVTASLITLARALEGKPACAECEALFMDALFLCVTNVNFDAGDIAAERAGGFSLGHLRQNTSSRFFSAPEC